MIDDRSAPRPVPSESRPGVVPVPQASDLAAERITEEVLQLLFVAQHEIADLEISTDPHADLARLRIHDAIVTLRDVVGLLQPQRTGLLRRPGSDRSDDVVPPLGLVPAPEPPAADAA